MNAAEAKSLTQKTMPEVISAEYSEIMKRVNEAIKRGEYEIVVNRDSLRKDLKNLLEKEGYKLTKAVSVGDNPLWVILWE